MTISKRITSSGLVDNGYHNLFAVTINKAGKTITVVRLRNSLDNSGEILWEFWGNVAGCFVKQFEPSLLFDTGIYADITGEIYSVIVEDH